MPRCIWGKSWAWGWAAAVETGCCLGQEPLSIAKLLSKLNQFQPGIWRFVYKPDLGVSCSPAGKQLTVVS